MFAPRIHPVASFSEPGVEPASARACPRIRSGVDLLRGKSLDDAAIGDEPLPAATGAEAPQLAGQAAQIGEFLFDCTAMLLRDAIHFGACLCFLRGQSQQIPDLVECEAPTKPRGVFMRRIVCQSYGSSLPHSKQAT